MKFKTFQNRESGTEWHWVILMNDSLALVWYRFDIEILGLHVWVLKVTSDDMTVCWFDIACLRFSRLCLGHIMCIELLYVFWDQSLFWQVLPVWDNKSLKENSCRPELGRGWATGAPHTHTGKTDPKTIIAGSRTYESSSFISEVGQGFSRVNTVLCNYMLRGNWSSA